MHRPTVAGFLTVAALALAGCSSASAHGSHLSADDQQFCASLGGDPVKLLRSDVDDLARDDHFATQGEAFAFESVAQQPSENTLNSANLQDAGLARARDAATEALSGLDVSPSQPSVDHGQLEQVQKALSALQSYCDTN